MLVKLTRPARTGHGLDRGGVEWLKSEHIARFCHGSRFRCRRFLERGHPRWRSRLQKVYTARLPIGIERGGFVGLRLLNTT